MTGGQDGAIRFWDLRKTDRAVYSFEDEHHWITSVKYNRFHDQLILSGSTSTYVSLYKATSVSSLPSNSAISDLN